MRLSRLLAMLAALLLPACSGSATDPARAALAGVYLLAGPVERGGPVSGTIALTETGQATRRVQYQSGTGTAEIVNEGTFVTVGEHAIELRLVEAGSGEPAYTWVVRATVDGDELTLSYPHPADGTVVERYRKAGSVRGPI